MPNHPLGRPSLRLPTYNYAQPGGYFVTICTQDRRSLFGHVTDNEMHPNAPGHMVAEVWEALPHRFPHISLDVSVVMPNHMHGIVLINEERPGQGLGQIIGAFKSLSTNRYITGVRQLGWPPFTKRIWQDNYFEHIIRNDASLDRIREYIIANPSSWDRDPERLP